MNKKLFVLISAIVFMVALLPLYPVFADGSPYGGHTPKDTGVDSFDSLYAIGFSSFSLGTTLLSIAAYTKSKIAIG